MPMQDNEPGKPVRHLSGLDATCVIVGIVVGAFIFKSPSWVAGLTGSVGWMMGAWLLGGLLCLCGALCYAELSTTYPAVGGEYVYLKRSYGSAVSFLFVWARATVIQTGSIAAVAYVFGDYLAKLARLEHPAPMLFALGATAALTVANVIGLRAGKWTQNVLTIVKIIGLVGVVGVAVVVGRSAEAAAGAPATAPSQGGWPGFDAMGLAMVFVLYTFGGWNEAAYVAGELRGRRRNMLWVLIGSVVLITAIYVAVNLAFLRVLGLEGMKSSGVVAADAMEQALGRGGAVAVTVLVAVSALGGLDGCIFTGSRAICALGADHAIFRPLGRWHERFRTPAAAILAQSAVAAVLIILPGLGEGFRESLGSGFDTAVEYTAPAFWLFLLLTGISVFVLRFKDRGVERPFRVPLLPLTATVFCLMSGWMLYRSLDYRLGGAVVGVLVLLAGVPVYLLSLLAARRRDVGA